MPNSLRISSDGLALELLHASGVARYVPNRSTTPVPALAAGTASSCLPSGNACNLLRLLDPAVSVSGVRWLVLYNIGAESGGVPLAESMQLWERGEQLAKICQAWLDGAKAKIDAARGQQPG